ncbi:hypothetical protein UFOVP635_10 [uncultured Caudovirales phage]|uniref:Uncharacterized protein n=1 Tax=uncultured Caudovirales phage TaxID=2100421 RepID=A0A6J5N8X7_9CAUD|nr:hypothetical protein UFOVP635_10 [uncultured Caudovirales phage]
MATVNQYPRARHRYNSNKSRVIRSGIEWALTYEEWLQWWADRGVDKNVPTGHVNKDSLCMQIIDKNRPFALDNVELASFGEGRIGLATKARGRPRIHLRKNKDEEIHKKFMPWHRARAQANYRNEEWNISFEEWCMLWPEELWRQRGRASQEYALSRIDPKQPWNTSNAVVAPRREHLQRIRKQQMEKKNG